MNEIDVSKLSIEQIDKVLNTLKEKQKEYQDIIDEQFNKEQAIKLVLNSIYGATGNQYMAFFDTNIAEAVTIQGKELILYSEKVLNHYFSEMWLKDTKLHEKLGIKINTENQYSDANLSVVYIDTDSCYVTFEHVFNSCNYQETKYNDNETDLILDIYNFRLKDYLESAFKQFADKRNTDNCQVFELESISKAGIWTAKKKYFLDIVWEDPGVNYKSLNNIKSKGIEVIQSSTPSLVRGELKKLLNYFLSAKVTTADVVEKLKILKEKFINEPDIDKICKNIKLNDYEKYCVNDKTKIEVGLKCPAHVAGGIRHNYLLNNSKHKDKYENIQSGMKVKMYYTNDQYEYFSYIAGSFPNEFAPKIDYDILFFKTVTEPINSILESMKLPTIDIKLEYRKAIF